MPKRLQTLFVIADGSRARWVKRSAATGDLVTVNELKADPLRAPPHGPPGVVFDSQTGRGSGLRDRSEPARRGRARFARELAQGLNALASERGMGRLVVIAPARTLREVLDGLSEEAQPKLAGTLAKDLTKVADHDLTPWLNRFEFR